MLGGPVSENSINYFLRMRAGINSGLSCWATSLRYAYTIEHKVIATSAGVAAFDSVVALILSDLHRIRFTFIKFRRAAN